MKRKTLSLCTVILCGSLMLNSCIGSFGLTHKLYDWNKSVGDKVVNELIFLACNIIPIYPVVLFVDTVVLNSIEFWTGNSPLANVGEVKKVKSENGEYLVKSLENGYEISKGDQVMNLIYNREQSTWNVVYDGASTELLKINNDGTANFFLPNGGSINVTLDAQGVAEVRRATMSDVYFAKR
ncbi:hypothetical protein EZS27_007672 [termite gut metagenome]|uniref:DUF3332 domain-containing protein n=1 Tax=termite gut metagenome TaxID=433724 RepID=A0A5J4SEX7_9ZZZZ